MTESLIDDLSGKEVREVAAVLAAEYGIKFIPNLDRQLNNIQKVFGSLQNVKDKNVLDLGCGTHISSDDPRDKYTGPWFCRALQKLGANVVGVDIGELDGESFEHHTLDLRIIGALNILPSQSFDVINMNYVPYTAPITDEVEIEKIKAEVQEQMKRLLKPNGKLMGEI